MKKTYDKREGKDRYQQQEEEKYFINEINIF